MTSRRACLALHFGRSTYHYQSRRTDPALLKKRVKRYHYDSHAQLSVNRPGIAGGPNS